MAANKFDIVHKRALTGHPLAADGTVVDPSGVQPDAIEDIIPSFRRLHNGYRSAETTECRLAFIDNELGSHGMQTYQGGAGSHFKCSGDVVPSLGDIYVLMLRDCFLKNFGIICYSIA